MKNKKKSRQLSLLNDTPNKKKKTPGRNRRGQVLSGWYLSCNGTMKRVKKKK